MRRHIADHFEKNVFYGGLTYNSHPLACAAALATIAVYEEDNLIENARSMGDVDARAARGSCRVVILQSAQRATSGSLELSKSCEIVKRANRWRHSMAPRPRCRRWESSSAQEGLYTFVRWNTFFTNPPLCITEAEMREAFAIIDKGLEITDKAVNG